MESDSVDDDLREVEHGHDAEAWSVTMDKTTLQTMSARDIKRQDHIWGNWSLFVFLPLVMCLSVCLSVCLHQFVTHKHSY